MREDAAGSGPHLYVHTCSATVRRARSRTHPWRPGRCPPVGGPYPMSLRHALLAILAVEPMTGYDLTKHFDRSAGNVWHAPHSQIYPELRKLESAGLVTAESEARGEHRTQRPSPTPTA